MSEPAETGEEVDGSSLFVYDGETAEQDYLVGSLAVGEGRSLEVIFVCDIDGRTLVAVPQVAWNRRAGPRKLPPGALVKATAVEVAGASRASRTEIADGARIKIWLGFLIEDLVASVSFDSDGSDIDYRFQATGGDAGFLPHSAALVEVAKDKFQFHTASENPAPRPAPLPVADPALDQRMVRLEEAVATMAASLKTLTQAASRPAAPAPSPQSSTPRAERRPTVSTEELQGLDAGVVRAALAAGVDKASLEDMAKLLAGNPAKQLKDTRLKRPVPKAALEESDEEPVPTKEQAQALDCQNSPWTPWPQLWSS